MIDFRASIDSLGFLPDSLQNAGTDAPSFYFVLRTGKRSYPEGSAREGKESIFEVSDDALSSFKCFIFRMSSSF